MPKSTLPPAFRRGPLNLNEDGTKINYKKPHAGQYKVYREQADAEEIVRLLISSTNDNWVGAGEGPRPCRRPKKIKTSQDQDKPRSRQVKIINKTSQDKTRQRKKRGTEEERNIRREEQKKRGKEEERNRRREEQKKKGTEEERNRRREEQKKRGQ